MSVSQINQEAFQYWSLSGYSQNNINQVCEQIDAHLMAARITFLSPGVEVAITRRTWERQEGHYPTVSRFFEEVSRHEALHSLPGSLIVWLEDGLWELQQKYSLTAPILSFGRHRSDHRSFLIPDPAYMGSFGYKQELSDFADIQKALPWNKRKRTIYWRGAATGLGIESDCWPSTARGSLCLLANEINDPTVLDAKITKVSHLPIERQKEMFEKGVIGDPVNFTEFLKYRYLVDADGYCCAWKSLMLKLASGSVTLKVHSEYEQWFYRELVPWRNYIPVRPDVADLSEIYQWLLAHDTEAQDIARSGRDLVHGLTYERAVNEVALLCASVLGCRRHDKRHAETLQGTALS